MEIFRQITASIDTVPHATTATPHTFTATASRKLSYTGPDDLRATLDKYSRIWLWFPTNNVLAEIQSYGQYGAYLPEGQVVTLGTPEVGHVVQGLLTYYSLTNTSGSSSATVNGVNLNSGNPVEVGIPGQSVSPVTLDVVVVDASNSDVRVIEQK